MKVLIYSLLLSTLFFASCNNAPKEQTGTASDTSTVGKSVATTSSTTVSSVSAILTAYLELKNALAKDNDKDAAASGKALETAFADFDKASLTADKAKTYTDIAENAKEHAEHIAANAGNIKHQREHFETLSQDIYDLIKAFGAGQKLYVDHCPMYNNNKGANWISESKEISNPYLGQSMPTCGTVTEELN
jgi:pectate lyase